jgi:capsular exopolysaccharide synthesis family protein
MSSKHTRTESGDEAEARHSYPRYLPVPAAAHDTPTELMQEVAVRDPMSVLVSWWWVILLAAIVGTGVGAVRCYTAVPRYRATCRVELVRDPRLSFDHGDSSLTSLLDREVSRHSVVIESASLHNEVTAALSDKWKGKLPEDNPRATVSTVAVRRAASMLDISVDAVSGDYALEFLATLLDQFRARRRADIISANENATSSLRTEQEAVGKELRVAQEALVTFQGEHNMRFTETKAHFDEMFLASLAERQNALRMERTLIEAQFATLRGASAPAIQDALALAIEIHDAARAAALLSAAGKESVDDRKTADVIATTPALRSGPDWQSLEMELAQLERQYKGMLDLHQADHPKMVELKRKMDDVRGDITLTAEIAMKRLQARYDAVKTQETALEEAARTWRSELVLSSTQRAEYEDLQAKVEHLKKLYDDVYARVLDGTALSTDALYNRTVDEPKIVGPVWPDHKSVMAIAIGAVLALGVALAYLLDHFENRVADLLAVGEKLGMPLLGGVPDWRQQLKRHKLAESAIVVDRERGSSAAEVYRALRSSLDRSTGEKRPYALLVTSPDASEGKTFTALNLSVVSAWTGKRVLLVDADLRKGQLHRHFNLTGDEGLAGILDGRTEDWRSAVQVTPYENLSVIVAGKFHSGLPELLTTTRLREMIDLFRQAYDLIIFDSAPIGRVVDSVGLAHACDGALLVVHFGTTRTEQVRQALGRMEGAPVLGFCLNGIRYRRVGYGHRSGSNRCGYGYGYAYGYGRGKSRS